MTDTGGQEERWFNAVKVRVLAWIAVGFTVPLMGLTGGIFLSSINGQLTDIKAGQKASVEDQKTTAGQVQAVQQNLAVMQTAVTEGRVKSVETANDVNATQTKQIDDLRDRLGRAEGDLKVLQELNRLKLPNPEAK